MIRSVELENFKAFRSLPSLELGPLTILCGSNSCGKSSVLQSLLLLKQTLESQNPNQVLLVNGRLVHLGSMADLVYGHEKPTNLSLEYVLPVSPGLLGQGGRSIPFNRFSRELFPEISARVPGPQMRLKVVLSHRARRTHGNAFQPMAVEELAVSTESVAAENEPPIACSSVQLVRRGQTADYDVTWHNLSAEFLSRGSSTPKLWSGHGQLTTLSFSNIFPSRYGQFTVAESSFSVPEQGLHMATYGIMTFLSAAKSYCTSLMSSLSYVGPLREEPARRYIYEDEVVDVGVKGENAAYIYLVEQDTTLDPIYSYDSETQTFVEKRKERLGSAVEEWLSSMGIRGLTPKGDKNGIISLLLESGASSRSSVNIADVGFGVSQVFPIVVAGLRARTGSCLLLEQPEIHLHPGLQMQLADYLLSLALANKQIVVETHSDHLINRIVRRVVEDPTGNIAKLVRIYFVESSGSGSKVELVKLDPDRGIVNWPRGFFDQTANEQALIMEAGIRKRRNTAGVGKRAT